MGGRSSWPSRQAIGNPRKVGAPCSGICASVGCVRRSWSWAMGIWGSGRPCTRCIRKPRNSVVGTIRSSMCSINSRRGNRRPARRCSDRSPRPRHGGRLNDAAKCLETDWERLVTFYRFPQPHWQHLRTSNPVESPFAAARLRTDAAKCFKLVKNATAVIWKDAAGGGASLPSCETSGAYAAGLSRRQI